MEGTIPVSALHLASASRHRQLAPITSASSPPASPAATVSSSIQSPRDKRHGGLRGFPGGKCEPGESGADAARRELAEELGVEAVAVSDEDFAIADPGSPFFIAFVPVSIVGEPTCHEHSALAWGTLAEIAELALAPSDRRYVEVLLGRAAAADMTRAPAATS